MIKITPTLNLNSTFDSNKLLHDFISLQKKLDMPIPNLLLPAFKEFFSQGLVPEALETNFTDMFKQKFISSHLYFELNRRSFVQEYGFVLLSNKLLNILAEQLQTKNILEIGAGTGFLTKNLLERGLSVIAIDHEAEDLSSYEFTKKHTHIIQAEGATYLKQNSSDYDVIILSWPNYEDDFATDILNNMKPGQQLYYIGEGIGGCTANDNFFNSLEEKTSLNENLTNQLQEKSLIWPGMHDDWYVYDIK
jgi:SAM-dependent methyltransferase